MSKDWLPTGSSGVVGLRLESCGLELAQEVGGRCVGEAHVRDGEILIEDRRVEEASHLLLFDGVARESENVATAGKDSAGDFVIQRGKKNQLTLIERDFRVATAKFDAMLGFNLISRGGVKAQSIEGIVELMGGARCGARGLGCGKTAQHEEGCCEPHVESVVILGVGEQEYAGRRRFFDRVCVNGTQVCAGKFKVLRCG